MTEALASFVEIFADDCCLAGRAAVRPGRACLSSCSFLSAWVSDCAPNLPHQLLGLDSHADSATSSPMYF